MLMEEKGKETSKIQYVTLWKVLWRKIRQEKGGQGGPEQELGGCNLTWVIRKSPPEEEPF